MNLFIDSNVYLSFFQFTSDDLEELKKLEVLIRKKRVLLIVPEQVRNEFFRNREGQIYDSIKKIRAFSLNLQFPNISREYSEFKSMTKLKEEFALEHAQIIRNIITDAESHSLKADKIVTTLFKKGFFCSLTEEIYSKAEKRLSLGNPPGKRGSIGDAVNWETLLELPEIQGDIHLVSDDNDFFSELNSKCMKEFLLEEWKNKRKTNIYSYRKISEFFKEHFPDIKFAADLEIELLIDKLMKSPCYTTTHKIIASLNRFSGFSRNQTNQLADALKSNRQVSDLLFDDDVWDFFSALLSSKNLNQESRHDIEERLAEVKRRTDEMPKYNFPNSA